MIGLWVQMDSERSTNMALSNMLSNTISVAFFFTAFMNKYVCLCKGSSILHHVGPSFGVVVNI